MSVMTTLEAPIAFAVKSETRPIGPEPVIRIVWPEIHLIFDVSSKNNGS